MEETNLNRLAQAFQRGDPSSYRELVERLTRPLIAMAYRYIQDWEHARDISQETWIKVYEHIKRYDPERSFKTWLLTIHRNGCLSHLRRASLRYEQHVDHDAVARYATEWNPGPDEEFERKEFQTRLLEAVTRLSRKQQLVYTTVDIEQTNQADAAIQLGMNPVTLRTTLHQARRRLAGMLRKTEE
jgi:RNA polymerase sigma-70 factor (ECF subfamily)